ncbi:cobalamin biosynthesis protein [Kiritimatiella glycovorans]|uniref:cobalamin biosynthesis protein n=1 Tax=Kiritimatiella glycovorans TaxID=1307763 RepID=UPI00069B1CFC|nr:cobalamin biosynthesis protein [Kiritimatiella glycovorans]
MMTIIFFVALVFDLGFLTWVPSKITAFLISLSFGFSPYALGAWRWTGKQLLKGPELNGDTAEPAMAAGLGVRLGGMNFYKGVPIKKAQIGDEIELLSIRHIYQSIRVSYASAILMLLVSIFIAGRDMIL